MLMCRKPQGWDMAAKQSQPEDMEKTTDPRGLWRFYLCPNLLAQAGSIWAVVVCLSSVCHLSVCCVTYPNGQSPNLSSTSYGFTFRSRHGCKFEYEMSWALIICGSYQPRPSLIANLLRSLHRGNKDIPEVKTTPRSSIFPDFYISNLTLAIFLFMSLVH